MEQTRLESLFEVSINVFIGWGLALLTQLVVFPLYGINVTFGEQLGMSSIFTTVAILRGYVIRRWFNAGIHKLVAQFVKKLVRTS